MLARDSIKDFEHDRMVLCSMGDGDKEFLLPSSVGDRYLERGVKDPTEAQDFRSSSRHPATATSIIPPPIHQLISGNVRVVALHRPALVSMTTSKGLIACSFCSRRTSTSALSATSSRLIRSRVFHFKNLRRSDRKSPCFRGRKPSQPPRISHHGCNRTRSGNRTRRDGYLV